MPPSRAADDLERLLTVLRTRPGASEGTSWGPEDLVFKVGGKVFAVLARDDEPPRLSLKCDPERVDELRAVFAAITPPPYFNKRHWNLVTLDGTVPTAEIEALIEHSWELVVAGLPRAERARILATAAGDP